MSGLTGSDAIAPVSAATDMARRLKSVIPAFVVFSLALSACATQTAPTRFGAASAEPAPTAPAQGRSGALVSGDSNGLGISGPKTPEALQAIVAAPYAMSSPPDCAAMAREIAELDDLLGPDVDILADPKAGQGLDDRAARALGSAVRGAIPYRWALRWLTKAGDRDKQLRLAVLAGAARRGFLKGVSHTVPCPAKSSASFDPDHSPSVSHPLEISGGRATP